MPYASFPTAGLCIALISGGLAMLPATAGAQDTMSNPVTTSVPAPGSSPETIEVIAPRLFKTELNPPNGTLQKASLEGPVRYDDLDLRTDQGVAEFKSRISQEAADICAHLGAIYPVYTAVGSSCVKDAIGDATIRANRVITSAREKTY